MTTTLLIAPLTDEERAFLAEYIGAQYEDAMGLVEAQTPAPATNDELRATFITLAQKCYEYAKRHEIATDEEYREAPKEDAAAKEEARSSRDIAAAIHSLCYQRLVSARAIAIVLGERPSGVVV